MRFMRNRKRQRAPLALRLFANCCMLEELVANTPQLARNMPDCGICVIATQASSKLCLKLMVLR